MTVGGTELSSQVYSNTLSTSWAFALFQWNRSLSPSSFLGKNNLTSPQYSASALIFCYDPQRLIYYTLLCLLAPLGKDNNGKVKKKSWTGSWEPPMGACEKSDQAVLSTAERDERGSQFRRSVHFSPGYMDS
jgi:hypothetical protein